MNGFYTEEIMPHEATELLAKCGLKPPTGIDYAAGVFDSGGKLVATGSLKGDMIQGIAVDPDYQGEDLMAKVITELVSYQGGQDHEDGLDQGGQDSLYLFTKPQNVLAFEGLGFRHVATAEPYASLMEWGKDSLGQYKKELEKLRNEALGICGQAETSQDNQTSQTSQTKASVIVMNCNPFTKGHRYLVEQAVKDGQPVFVLVVEEEASLFSYEDRLEMARRATADLPNVFVTGGGRYAVSSLTFPSYFTKEENLAKAHASMDAEIFVRHIGPALGASKRYLGTEPISVVTESYNEVLKSRLPKAGIQVVEVPRLEAGGMPVSASQVRAMLYRLLAGEAQNPDELCLELEELLPITSLEYILSPDIEGKLCRALTYGEERWK